MLSQTFDILEEDFSRPVESIMRCEDFKSNFARKLSNRYTFSSPISVTKQETVAQVKPKDIPNALTNVSEKIDLCTKVARTNGERNGEMVKPVEKHTKHSTDIRFTEVSALNMEVETLRWQLAQTEANRQMHIALLKQIVTFLNRVKEHIEFQHSEPEICMPSKIQTKSLNMTDLPRSRSVFHVNKNIEYSISPVKKISTKKISKSISNVNGYNKDSTGVWGQSKISIIPENETGQKLTEEMTRLITLANTVLSTKLPDLACTCIEKSNEIFHLTAGTGSEDIQNISLGSLNHIEEDATDSIVIETNCKNTSYNSITNKVKDVNTRIVGDYIVSKSSITCKLENGSTGMKVYGREQKITQTGLESIDKVVQSDKRIDYGASSNYIEDESGFSSMSSFQEIGIPIISIIPPSPCKEVDILKEITNDADKWKKSNIELDKQSVKVFWV